MYRHIQKISYNNVLVFKTTITFNYNTSMNHDFMICFDIPIHIYSTYICIEISKTCHNTMY